MPDDYSLGIIEYIAVRHTDDGWAAYAEAGAAWKHMLRIDWAGVDAQMKIDRVLRELSRTNPDAVIRVEY